MTDTRIKLDPRQMALLAAWRAQGEVDALPLARGQQREHVEGADAS